MFKIAAVKPNGEISYTYHSAHEIIPAAVTGLTFVTLPDTFVDTDDTVLLNEYAFVGGQLTNVGQRPTNYHSLIDGAWGVAPSSLSQAISEKTAPLEGERINRNFLPIVYDGKRIDADAKAQKNLSDKLQGVRERIRLGIDMPVDEMVWRDADNIVHEWTDLQTYHDWLSGYTIALDGRGTRLYKSMWWHKEQIKKLTTVEAVIAYDITLNWAT